MHGIFVDTVQQVPVFIKAVLRALRNQVKRVFAGHSKLIHKHIDGAHLLLYVISEGITQHKGVLRHCFNVRRIKVFCGLRHRGHCGGYVLHVFPEVVVVDVQHCFVKTLCRRFRNARRRFKIVHCAFDFISEARCISDPRNDRRSDRGNAYADSL